MMIHLWVTGSTVSYIEVYAMALTSGEANLRMNVR